MKSLAEIGGSVLGGVKSWLNRQALDLFIRTTGRENIPVNWPQNWWQKGWIPTSHADFEEFGPVAACVSIISQDISRIPLRHIRELDNNGIEVVTTKSTARVFRKPNSYQSIVDFLLYLGRSLLMDGNFYAIPIRNDRFEIAALYPVHPACAWPYIAPDGSVFYRITTDPTTDLSMIDIGEWLPQRDILHIRLQTPKHPLIGETPLVSAVYPTLAGMQINKHNAKFFQNLSRPSGVLRHPGELSETAMERIKKRFMQLTQSDNIGEPIVLQEGMEWSAMTMTAVDAELAKSYALSEKQILQIFRVPPFLAGDLQDATLNNVETLTRFYYSSCLSFYETLIEQALTNFFNLPANEKIEFDVETALLTSDFKQMIDALAKSTQGGIHASNEARARLRLPKVENGDEPRVQQQMVPLSWGTEEQQAESVDTTGANLDDGAGDAAADDDEDLDEAA